MEVEGIEKIEQAPSDLHRQVGVARFHVDAHDSRARGHSDRDLFCQLFDGRIPFQIIGFILDLENVGERSGNRIPIHDQRVAAFRYRLEDRSRLEQVGVEGRRLARLGRDADTELGRKAGDTGRRSAALGHK